MKKNLIIISAGKLGREVQGWASHAIAHGADLRIKGYLDDRSGILDGRKGFAPVLGSVESYRVETGDVFLCAVGDPAERKRYQERLEKDREFVTLIHPSAVLGINVVLGPGSLVAPFCHVSADVKTGKGVFFLPHGNIAHDCVFGDFCQVSGSCELNGNITCGEGVFVGSHSTVLPGAILGDWCYIGAHSLVLRKVSSQERVFGNPAVPLRTPHLKAA